jgi:hypothetical protein
VLRTAAAPLAALRRRLERGLERAVARRPILVRETHARRDRAALLDRGGGCRLAEIDQLAVVAEVAREQLRVLIETETADHQPVEVPQQKIGEIEGAQLRLRELREDLRAGEELVAMGARYALDALLLENRVQKAARSAIRVRDEQRAVVAARGLNQRAHGGGNPFGPIMQLGGKAFDVHMSPAVRTLERHDLVRQRAAGDDQDILAAACHGA